MKTPLILGDEYITAPLPRSAAAALAEWLYEHDAELIELLAPYGVHPHNMPVPEWRVIVGIDDVAAAVRDLNRRAS